MGPLWSTTQALKRGQSPPDEHHARLSTLTTDDRLVDAPQYTSGRHIPLRTLGTRFDRDGAKVRLQGTTYGTFARRADGALYPRPDMIARDLTQMAARGCNAVRLYTPPPPDLLDVADDLGLALLVGLHEPDLQADPPTSRRGARRLRDAGWRAVDELAERCRDHRSVVGVSVGNEVPVDVVRLLGARTVEDLLSDRVAAVHEALPGALVTYVNFPTTEFLEPVDLDFLSFNVFLESPSTLRRYLTHLQVLGRGRPLVITELGLAGDVHGDAAQAESLAWQLRTLDEVGCAGGFVFAWTDEWAVADVPVDGWGFGVTRADRTPKPALDVVNAWCRSDGVRPVRRSWPRMSVVVCAYNEEQNIEQCLRAACAQDYPAFEVIVCDDGSTDSTAALASTFPVRLLELPRGGLSRARNAGWRAAAGDIVVYLDADAYPDQDWLRLLALSFDDGVVASGGRNLPAPDAGLVERAVAVSPGSPREVLLEATRAEHVPGCTLAVRRDTLGELGGFNPVYTAAGDDVDLCWRILDRGWDIAFAPGAQIFHHRRATVRGYLRQQRGYGRAERLLTTQHPHRFNRLGNARWLGFVYGESRLLPRWLRPVVYTGWAGSAPFQPIAERRSEVAATWIGALLPLWAVVGLATAPLAVAWPALWALPALVALSIVGYGAAIAAALPVAPGEPNPRRLRGLAGLLHMAQPLVRAWGRLTCRPPAPDPPDTEWTGDRLTWVADARRRLEVVHRLRVRVGPTGAPWDMTIRRWGLVTAEVTTATLWRWVPRWRLTVRPSRSALAAVTLATLFADVFGSPALAVGAVAVLVGMAVDWAVTRRRVMAAMCASAAGAEQQARASAATHGVRAAAE